MPCWKWGFLRDVHSLSSFEGWILWLRGLTSSWASIPSASPAISHLFPYIHPDSLPDTPSSEKDFQLPLWWRAPSCLGLCTPLFGALRALKKHPSLLMKLGFSTKGFTVRLLPCYRFEQSYLKTQGQGLIYRRPGQVSPSRHSDIWDWIPLL